MKYPFICFCLIVLSSFHQPEKYKPATAKNLSDTGRNIFIITLDGFRWQELFNGADSEILSDSKFTSDPEMTGSLYGGSSPEERRKKLLPFLWNVAASKGQAFGNRAYENEVNVANLYNISYAGYNELFTGTTDLTVFSNDKVNNRNRNIFEYLNNKDAYKGRIALFTSWDVFPFILNEKRNGLALNSGYQSIKTENQKEEIINEVQENVNNKEQTRYDMLTYLSAREYLELHRPKVFFLGLGETDEYAHKGNYDAYLQKANEADHIIGELWHWVQSTEGYRNNTTFIITTDHGRGSAPSQWTKHGTFVKGSSQAWMMIFGRGVISRGEIRTKGSIFQKQLAQTIAAIAGEDFGRQEPISFAAN